MSVAAGNNAEWCDAMCRAHGLTGVFAPDAWTCPRRTPPLYPDAVTLSPAASAGEVLARVDAGPGCSVKDSFARLDLAAAGFTPIIDALWLQRSPGDTPGRVPPDRWSALRTADRLRAWVSAFDDGPADLFPPALLDDPAVRILAAERGGAIVGGAVLNAGATVTGVSNLFAVDGDLDRAWRGLLAALPATPLVTYAAGPALDAALRHRWSATGPLRVWLRPGGAS
jgi:hypothetical protein